MPVTSPGVTCAPDRLAMNQIATTPSFGSINLLQRLTELRDAFYSLDHWLIIKGYNAATSQLEDMHGAKTGASLGPPLSPNLLVFTGWQASEPCLLGF